MFWYPLALLFFVHSLTGQSLQYVDGPYYKFVRTNDVTPQIPQWPTFLQTFMQQLQQQLNVMPNIPFSVWQPQVPVVSKQPDLTDIIQKRQFDIFNLLRCVVEQQPRKTCLHLLDRNKKLYPPSVLIGWEPTTPAVPPVLEPLPVAIDKPLMVDKPVPSTMEVRPVVEEKPAVSTADIKPLISQVKPVHTETSVIKGPGGSQTTITETKLPHGQAISVSTVSGSKFMGRADTSAVEPSDVKNFFGKMFEKSM